MGTCGLGKPAGFALLAMFFITGATRSVAMLYYIKLWVIFAIYRRLTADKSVHTDTPGYPILTAFIRHDYLAYVAEALLVAVIGHCLSGWSPVVGKFLMGCSFALWMELLIAMAVTEQQKRAAHNANAYMNHMQQQMNKIKTR